MERYKPLKNIGGNNRMITLRQIAVFAICVILLLSFFLFVPAFDPEQQLRGAGYANSSSDKPVPVDSSFSLMLDWMDNQTESGTFRYQIIPSLFSTLTALGSTIFIIIFATSISIARNFAVCLLQHWLAAFWANSSLGSCCCHLPI